MGSFRPRNFTECIQLLWHRKVLILFVTAVVTTAICFVIQSIPNIYHSSALVMVSGPIYDAQSNGAQVAAVSQQATSRSTLETLIQRYGLYDPVSREKIDLAVGQMTKDIKFETKMRSDQAGFPESFSIVYRHTDPKMAQQVVTDMVSVFQQANDTMRKQAAEEAATLNREIADLEARLNLTAHQRAAASARSSAASRASGEMSRQRAERAAIESSVETLGDRQYMLERQIAEQKRLIAQQQEIVRNAPPAADNTSANSYGSLLRKKGELEARLADYQSQYTESHPRIQQAREQLAEINTRIAQLNATGEQARASRTSPESQELRGLQRELTRMETELDVVIREIARKRQAAGGRPSVAYSAPVVAAPSSGGEASPQTSFTYETLRERYGNLLKKQDSLQRWQLSATGTGPDFFQVMDQPNLPKAPTAPNRRSLMLMGLAFAFGIGLIVAAAAEAPRLFKVSNDTDVQYYLGVPVVALIPETLTPDERGLARRTLATRRLAVLVAGAALVPALIFLLNALQVFQILAYR